jgi:hypothetical protein
VEHAAHREVDDELEALRGSAAWVQYLVLERPDMTSSLVALLSSVAELLKGCIDVAAANRACCSIRSALSATLLHILELGTELELLGFGRNVDLTND